jgi:hypothetical protein
MARTFRALHRIPDGDTHYESVTAEGTETRIIHADGTETRKMYVGFCHACIRVQWERNDPLARCDWPESDHPVGRDVVVVPAPPVVPAEFAGTKVEAEPVQERPVEEQPVEGRKHRGFFRLHDLSGSRRGQQHTNPRDPQYVPPKEPPPDSAMERRLRWGPGPGGDW